MRTAKTLIRLGEYPCWSESSLGAHVLLLVIAMMDSLRQQFYPRMRQAGRDKKNRWAHTSVCYFVMLCLIWAAAWQNQQNGLCAQRRLRSVWASAHSDQSIRCPHNESFQYGHLATHWAHSEDSCQTGWMPGLIWDFAGRTCHFFCFVTSKFICSYLSETALHVCMYDFNKVFRHFISFKYVYWLHKDRHPLE